MDDPRDYHTRQRKTNIIGYHLCVEPKKKKTETNLFWTYLQNRNRPIDIEKKLMVTKGRGINQEFGIKKKNIYIYITIHKIDNKQESTIEHRELYSIFYNNLWGKRLWKATCIYLYLYMCVCITELLCCTPESNTAL